MEFLQSLYDFVVYGLIALSVYVVFMFLLLLWSYIRLQLIEEDTRHSQAKTNILRRRRHQVDSRLRGSSRMATKHQQNVARNAARRGRR